MITSTGKSDTEAFRVSRGDILSGPSSEYVVASFLGEGSFGKVAKCLKIATKEWVAIKIIKDHPDLIHQAEQEIAMLKSIQSLYPDRCAIVRWNSCFVDKRHLCLEFELLGMSLFDQLHEAQVLNLNDIRIILYQLAAALGLLQLTGIIHRDIKPENIMLVKDDSLKVKIIDFGLSCHVSQAEVGVSAGTMYYQAPELLLGLPFTGAIDVWALGCVAVELFTGSSIYPGDSEYQMLQFITETQGPFPEKMLDSGIKTKRFFTSGYNLKNPTTYHRETGITTTETRYYFLSTLDDLPVLADMEEDQEMLHFVDLVKRMMQLDPSQRISPMGILHHPFFVHPHAPAAAVQIQANADHTHASNNQSTWDQVDVGQSPRASLSEEGAWPEFLPSPHPLGEIRRKRHQEDLCGNSNQSIWDQVDVGQSPRASLSEEGAWPEFLPSPHPLGEIRRKRHQEDLCGNSNQSIWDQVDVGQSPRASLSEEGAWPEFLPSPHPLGGIRRKRHQEDLCGNSSDSQEFSPAPKRMRFSADTNRVCSTSSPMVTMGTQMVSEPLTPAADIQPEVTVKSWRRRFTRFFSRLGKTLCCCCCPSDEQLS